MVSTVKILNTLLTKREILGMELPNDASGDFVLCTWYPGCEPMSLSLQYVWMNSRPTWEIHQRYTGVHGSLQTGNNGHDGKGGRDTTLHNHKTLKTSPESLISVWNVIVWNFQLISFHPVILLILQRRIVLIKLNVVI